MATANLTLRGDLSNLRKELAAIPGITEAEAKRMVARLNKNLKRAEADSTKTWKRAKRNGPDRYAAGVGALKGVFAAVFAGVAVQTVGRATRAIVSSAAEVNKLRKRAREAGEEFESFQRVEGAMNRLTRGGIDAATATNILGERLADARDPASEAGLALGELGLEADDLIGLPLDQKLTTISDALEGVSDQEVRAALRADLLGRAGRKLGPLFDAGTAGIRSAMGDVVTISESAAAASARVTDKVQKLSEQWLKTRAEFIEDVEPAINDIVIGLGNMMDAAGKSGVIEELAFALSDLAAADIAKGINEATEAMDKFATAIEGTSKALSFVRSGADLLPAILGDTAQAILTADKSFTTTTDHLETLGEGFGFVREQFTDAAPRVHDLTSEFFDYGAALREITDDEAKANDHRKTGAQLQREQAEAAREAAQAEREAAQAAREEAAARAELFDTVRSASADMLSAEEAILAARDEQLAQVQALTEASGDYEAGELARVAVVNRAEREIASLRRDAYAEETRQRREAYTAAIDDAWEQGQAEARAFMEGQRAKADGMAQIGQMLVRSSSTITDMILRNNDNLTEGQKDAVLALFAIQKAGAIATAAVNTGLAVTQALGSTSPPANFVLAAASGVAGGIAIAAIAAEPPPKFHSGMAPDEYTATLRRPEAVLSQRGVQAVGGSETVRDLNRGRGGAQRVVVAQVVNNRTTFAAEYEAIRTGRSPYSRRIEEVRPTRTGMRLLQEA